MPTTPPWSAESNDVRPPCRTAAVTGVPSANSGHCSAIPDAVAALWDLRRGTRHARHSSRYYSANSCCLDSTSPHQQPRTVPCSGRDPASPRVPQGGMLSTSIRRPGPPPSRGPGPPRDSRTPLAHALALHPGGPGPPRAPHIYAGPWPAGPTECRHATLGRRYTLQR